MMNYSERINRNPLKISEGESRNFTDAFALAWIFSATLTTGLLILDVNRISLVSVAFSLSLAIIWWRLSNHKHS